MRAVLMGMLTQVTRKPERRQPAQNRSRKPFREIPRSTRSQYPRVRATMVAAMPQSRKDTVRPHFSAWGLALRRTAPTRVLIPRSTLNTEDQSSGVSSREKRYPGAPARSVFTK